MITYHVRCDFDPTRVKSVYANTGYDFRHSGMKWPYSPKGGVWTSQDREFWHWQIGREYRADIGDDVVASIYAVDIDDDIHILEINDYVDQQLFLMEYQNSDCSIDWLRIAKEYDAIHVSGDALTTSTFSLWSGDTLLILNIDVIHEFINVEKGNA